MRRRADGEAAAHGAERRFAGVVEAFAADPRTAKLAREYATREPTAGARFGSNGLEVKGRLFAMLVRGALVVKLPKRRVDALVAEGAGERFDPRHGRVMKEWLVVRGDTPWLELAREAHDSSRAVGAPRWKTGVFRLREGRPPAIDEGMETNAAPRVGTTTTASPAQLEQHRAAVTGHCYRMLGSLVEADDAVQETMVRAWRSLDRFDGRASLRTWLYRIATNVCLDALADRARRERPVEAGPAGTVDDPLVEHPRTHWLEPVPDARAVPADADPSERAILRQSIRLAFVAALQHLPPRQRAALLLAEVLGWSAAEVADALQTSVPAVNSALQRARATLATRVVDEGTPSLSDSQAALLERYVELFERYDVDALAALLREDAAFSMPPYALWLRGRDAVRAWLLGRGAACRGSRMLPVGAANGLPAFAQYKPAGEGKPCHAWALAVLELSGDHISSWTSFLDVGELFPRFGLPLDLAP